MVDDPLPISPGRVQRWLFGGLLAALRGLIVGVLAPSVGLALFGLTVLSFALIPAAGLGFALYPAVVEATRWYTNLLRWLIRWEGYDILPPHRPVPPGAHLGTWQRFRHAIGDPASWRDFAWLVPGALAGTVFGLTGGGLTAVGLEGTLGIPFLLYQHLDWYGYGPFWPITNMVEAWLTVPIGVLLLAGGLTCARWLTWLHASFARLFLTPTRSAELSARVDQLTVTRAGVVDAQAAELRRIERDLHDGAQARLVSLSMSIGLAEELMQRDPQAARQLLAEARESSGLALGELRALVRGIHPPVLAERGLDGALRALALRVPLPIDVDIELDGRPQTPVESAMYFAVAEALANIAKHSGASRGRLRVRHTGAVLTATVGDDGTGGADPAAGSGLQGIGHRLAAFDGTMEVSSPPGGPTVVTLELPCELSSPKISPSSATD